MQKTGAVCAARWVAWLCMAVMLLSCVCVPSSAAEYRTGTNDASETYRSGRYYQYFSRVELTGDAVTDVLAVALSQLGYQEGNSEGAYSGEWGGFGNYSEYYYNFGMAASTWSEPWCAAFVSWALYQSGATDQGKLSDWCRGHEGDENYIWREIGCQRWANQLKLFDRFKERGDYLPQSGDLIFFYRDNSIGHVGLVVWCDGIHVYTVEGNTSSSSGIEANGGGVYYKSYQLTNTGIAGYGILPYERNENALKVDYSGANMTPGLYMVKTGKSLAVSTSMSGTEAFTVPMHRMLEVTDFAGGYAIVSYDGQIGYASLSSEQVLQVTATDATPTFKVHSSDSFYAGGTSIEEEHRNDPHVYVTYPGLTLSDLDNLQTYGNNASLVLINGWTWEKWESVSEDAIKGLWIEGNGEGSFYLGFDLGDPDALCLRNQYGMGEALESIVLKRGFAFVDPNHSDTVMTLEHNVILLARETGGFDVVLDGITYKNEQSAEQYGVVSGTSVNVRSEPNTNCTVYGQVNLGDKLVYLGEMSGNWCKVRYNGIDAWISGSYFTVTGHENVRVPVPMELDGYTVEIGRDGTVTVNAKNEPLVQEHTFFEKYDDYYHWIVCDCGEIKAIEAHRWETDGVCSECAYGRESEAPVGDTVPESDAVEDADDDLSFFERIFKVIGDFFRALFDKIKHLFSSDQ